MPNPLARAAETVAPARLGRPFRWLLASATVTNLGDGFALAAGPLLVASQTRDPFVVSLAAVVQYVPVLLFGAFAGTVADRFDRRRIIIAVNLARAAVLAVLATIIVTGAVSIAAVLLSMFALGVAEVFADVGATSLLPRLVPREHLGIANARLQGATILTNMLVAPPIGAALFAVGMALPFAADAVAFLLGALLIARMVVPPRAAVAEGEAGASVSRWWHDMADGVRWLAGNPPMRTLALTIFLFNITFGAAWGVLVLYSQERLGMTAVAFGLITTAMAIGGLIGTSFYGRLERRFSLADIMRVGLSIETATHLIFALTTSSVVVLATTVVFGAHAFVWGTTSTVVRQRAVPDEYLGRVTGVYSVGSVAGHVIGAPIGGLLAQAFGITAPFWFGFAGSLLLLAIMWRRFDAIVHAGDVAPAENGPAPA